MHHKDDPAVELEPVDNLLSKREALAGFCFLQWAPSLIRLINYRLGRQLAVRRVFSVVVQHHPVRHAVKPGPKWARAVEGAPAAVSGGEDIMNEVFQFRISATEAAYRAPHEGTFVSVNLAKIDRHGRCLGSSRHFRHVRRHEVSPR